MCWPAVEILALKREHERTWNVGSYTFHARKVTSRCSPGLNCKAKMGRRSQAQMVCSASGPRRLGRVARQLVDPLVLRMAVVALDPLPGDLVRRRRLDQLVPQVLIADRLLAGADPAFTLPALDPFGHSVDDIAAVGMDCHLARLDQRLEAADHRGHLHAVVGG